MTNQIGIYDHSTGEQIVREMTAEEQAEREAEVAGWLAEKEAEEQAALEAEVKRQALLEKLGITEEEAKLLLG